ncbi:PREDICTED: tetratricopeptide repeat protein 12 [Gekko japonicus]|uniref:Tetratricopeptide repeat protein 12 n=1 Tax=Gekko japonicus TaxID=146911 RepID=A0ABM1KUT3_GEKJA|nr:PREDICTED: tetratricopeptide repeat protein 12 [Gekko japonicus]
MSKQQEEQELQKFLRDVDEISNLIQGLNSSDLAVMEKAIAGTEKRLSSSKEKEESECRHRVDRTLINPRPSASELMFCFHLSLVGFAKSGGDDESWWVLKSRSEIENPGDSSAVSSLELRVGVTGAEAFMSALEKDANERARRRRKNEALANALKEQGNDAFSRGDFAAAIQKYTEGLKKQKDMPALYANRAQAYIKLQEHEKAILDCEWALRCDEKYLKAFFHMGKAYLALKQYSKSRECYMKILEIDPHKEKLCKDCLNEVDLEEKRHHEEEKATKEFESGRHGAVSVNQLLQELSRPNENALFYAGGIQLLTGIVQDGTEQTLFRTNNGFSIINDNKVIRRAFRPEMKSPAEAELSLWQAICKGNEENQRLLLTHPYVNSQLPTLLLSEVPEIQEQCLVLLSLYAQTEHGRNLLLRHLDLTKWLQTLMSFVSVFDSRASYAMNLLTSLIMEEK